MPFRHTVQVRLGERTSPPWCRQAGPRWAARPFAAAGGHLFPRAFDRSWPSGAAVLSAAAVAAAALVLAVLARSAPPPSQGETAAPAWVAPLSAALGPPDALALVDPSALLAVSPMPARPGSSARAAGSPDLVPAPMLALARAAGPNGAPVSSMRAIAEIPAPAPPAVRPGRRSESPSRRRAPAAAADALPDAGVIEPNGPVAAASRAAAGLGSVKRRSGDVLVAVLDADTIVVPDRFGMPVPVRIGQPLPSGARLVKVDRRSGTAETDRGPLRLE